MKHLFAIALVVMGILSIVAWAIRPRPVADGKVGLAWVSDDNPARREQIAVFNRLHPDLHLDLDPTNGGMEKVIVQSIGGVGPDLFDCYSGFELSAYVRSGIAWDVTDPLAKAGIDVRRDVWSAAWPNVLYEGRTYGFPTNACANALWINKDLFDACGVPYPKGPWTWEEFIPVAQKLTVRDASGRVRHFGLLCDWWNWPEFILQWGGRLYSENGTRCVVDSPEASAAIQFMQDLIYKYKVMPSPVEEAAMSSAGGWGSGSITFFGGGKGAMATGGRWWLCTLRTYEKLRLGAVESPHQKRRVFRGYGRATLVNRASPRREEALAFIKYMAGKEYNDLINHQADSLAPVIRFAYGPEYLHDPAYPAEDFNAVWREVLELSEPDPICPFINGNTAGRIFTKQMDLVKNGQKSGEEAMKAAARLINEEIQKTLQIDPELRARYDAIVAKGKP
jgi:multiple sugar transport system substrate-binding protein